MPRKPRKPATSAPDAPSTGDGEIGEILVQAAEAGAIVAASPDHDDQEDETGKDESENDDAPAQPEANSTAQLAMPLASIDVDKQGDVPLELGNVEARAKKPDGSTVVVTTKGKYRQAAPGEQWIDTILQSE